MPTNLRKFNSNFSIFSTGYDKRAMEYDDPRYIRAFKQKIF